MNGKKRIVSILTVMCLLAAMFVPQTALALPLAGSDEITILYTNDMHTYIEKGTGEGNTGWDYAKLADLKDSFEEQGEDVLLVDAGDHIQGTAYGDMDKGASIISLMSAAGYDLATPGNHEFDYGMFRALDVMQNSGISYISCNFFNMVGGVPTANVLNSYKIFEFGDGIEKTKVAFVGVTTPETITSSTPKYFQNEQGEYIYGIAGGTDGAELYKAVQDAIDQATAAGADYVIGIGHLGVDESSVPWRSADVIANTTGLDAFIDGHSHTEIKGMEVTDKAGEKVILTQTGSYAENIGAMTISASGITTELLGEDIAATATKDDTVLAIQNAWMAEVDEELGEVIGHTDIVLDNYDKDGNRLVRKQETNTGDFVTDALYYLFDNMDLDVDVAIMNGGGIRNKAVTGDMSYKTCKEIHTFGNVACLLEVSGQQILDALEWGAKDATVDNTVENGGFLQVSGMTYEIHSYIASTVQKDENGVWTGGPTGEYRVKNVQIFDKESGKYVPLDVNAKYNLAGYNYTLRDLGDGFAMFDGAVNILDYVMEDYMVLAEYVKSFDVDSETGLPTITAENSPYGELNGEGRIIIKTEATTDNGDGGKDDNNTAGDNGAAVGGNDKTDNDKTNNNKVPVTGDDANIGLWIGALIVAAAGGGFLVFRKKNNDDNK